LYLRSLDDLAPRALPGTENARHPEFSPDGKWLAFLVGTQLRKMPVAGGPVTNVADSVTRYSWGEGDVIAFAKNGLGTGPLYRVSAAGGPVTQLSHPDTARHERGHSWPWFLPGGRAVLHTIVTGGPETSELAVTTIDDGRTKPLGVQGVNPMYAANGYLVFGRLDGTAVAAPFDLRALQITGPAVTVLDNVHVKAGGAVQIALSRTGTLVMLRGQFGRQLVTLDRKGASRPFRSDAQLYTEPRFSPDGKRIAMRIGTAGGGGNDIWIHDIGSGTLTRLTRDGKNARPEWTADGKKLVWAGNFPSLDESVYWQGSDGSGVPELLLKGATNLTLAPSGRFGATSDATATPPGLYVVALDSTHKRTLFVSGATANGVIAARVSPDSRWVAYVSTESGRGEVYVRPYPGPGGAHQISINGGSEPLWTSGGREVLYRANGVVMSASIVTAPEFRVLRRDSLFADVYEIPAGYANWDVTPDGQRFLFLKAVGDQDPPVVVFGWLDELRERMALATKK
jgi:serine/threonine-protein kinase